MRVQEFEKRHGQSPCNVQQVSKLADRKCRFGRKMLLNKRANVLNCFSVYVYSGDPNQRSVAGQRLKKRLDFGNRPLHFFGQPLRSDLDQFARVHDGFKNLPQLGGFLAMGGGMRRRGNVFVPQDGQALPLAFFQEPLRDIGRQADPLPQDFAGQSRLGGLFPVEIPQQLLQLCFIPP